MYLIKFDETGKQRIDTKIADFIDSDKQAELLKAGYVEINDNDFNKLIGNNGNGANDNGYLYDSTTKTVVDAPAKPEPTAAEIKQNKITEIDNKYQAIFATLSQQLGVAMLNDNTDNQTAIKKDYQDALTAYKQELGAIQ